jgi:hypothetical protein
MRDVLDFSQTFAQTMEKLFFERSDSEIEKQGIEQK